MREMDPSDLGNHGLGVPVTETSIRAFLEWHPACGMGVIKNNLNPERFEHQLRTRWRVPTDSISTPCLLFLRGVASMVDLIIVHETSRDHPMYNPVLQCWNEYSRQSGVVDHS